MCNFWSCIITRDGKVISNKNNSSHDTLIEKGKLKDDKLIDRDFVRIEVTPIDIVNKPRDRSAWKLKVDEQKTLPGWYTEKQAANEELIWKAWEKAMKSTLWKLHLERVAEIVREVKSIKYFSMSGAIDA